MKKIILAAVFLFLPLCICFAQEAVMDPSRIWDFGQMDEGVVAEHVFILRNDSTEVMNIENVDSSCGCAASSAGKKILQPGEETEIKVKFNSKGYSGKIKQFIFVNVNRLNDPVIQFVIEADVKKGG